MRSGIADHTLTRLFRNVALVFAAFALPQAALAQDVPDVETVQDVAAQAGESPAAGEPAALEEAASPAAAAPGADAYTPLGPEWIKGQPVDGAIGFQPQHNADGEYALRMHNALLMPIIVAISLFVLGLLLWVIVRYRRSANPVASKTSHNTLIEVIWTLVPVLILVVIAIPSISLLASQYETPPEDAITVKATGYQWYWGYTYPDNGGFEVISNMLDEGDAIANGEPAQLAVDNRMVVPVGVPIRLQTTGADVIHSFAVPSLWFKLDAVPGRLNERLLTIDEPGIYYGQCSELCGARHAYMPIAVEAVPMADFRRWIAAQGGTFGDESEEPSAAPVQQPESAVPGAADTTFPEPTEDTAPGQPSAL